MNSSRLKNEIDMDCHALHLLCVCAVYTHMYRPGMHLTFLLCNSKPVWLSLVTEEGTGKTEDPFRQVHLYREIPQESVEV